MICRVTCVTWCGTDIHTRVIDVVQILTHLWLWYQYRHNSYWYGTNPDTLMNMVPISTHLLVWYQSRCTHWYRTNPDAIIGMVPIPMHSLVWYQSRCTHWYGTNIDTLLEYVCWPAVRKWLVGLSKTKTLIGERGSYRVLPFAHFSLPIIYVMCIWQ